MESPNQYKSESFMKIQHCCNADNFCESLFGSDTQLSTRKLGFKGQRKFCSQSRSSGILCCSEGTGNEYIQALLDKGACVNRRWGQCSQREQTHTNQSTARLRCWQGSQSLLQGLCLWSQDTSQVAHRHFREARLCAQ